MKFLLNPFKITITVAQPVLLDTIHPFAENIIYALNMLKEKPSPSPHG